jgi:hypothetical protein
VAWGACAGDGGVVVRIGPRRKRCHHKASWPLSPSPCLCTALRRGGPAAMLASLGIGPEGAVPCSVAPAHQGVSAFPRTRTMRVWVRSAPRGIPRDNPESGAQLPVIPSVRVRKLPLLPSGQGSPTPQKHTQGASKGSLWPSSSPLLVYLRVGAAQDPSHCRLLCVRIADGHICRTHRRPPGRGYVIRHVSTRIVWLHFGGGFTGLRVWRPS